MGDRVVELARDPGPFLDHRFAGGEIAFPLGQLGAPLSVAEDPSHEQHHDQHDDHEQRPATRRPTGRKRGGEDEEAGAEQEAPGRSPGGERVEGAELGDRIGGRLRVPEPVVERADARDSGADEQREAAARGERQRHRRAEQRNHQRIALPVAAQQRLEDGVEGEHDRQHSVDDDRIRP